MLEPPAPPAPAPAHQARPLPALRERARQLRTAAWLAPRLTNPPLARTQRVPTALQARLQARRLHLRPAALHLLTRARRLRLRPAAARRLTRAQLARRLRPAAARLIRARPALRLQPAPATRTLLVRPAPLPPTRALLPLVRIRMQATRAASCLRPPLRCPCSDC